MEKCDAGTVPAGMEGAEFIRFIKEWQSLIPLQLILVFFLSVPEMPDGLIMMEDSLKQVLPQVASVIGFITSILYGLIRHTIIQISYKSNTSDIKIKIC
jgi:hypothetical protein